MKTIFELVRIVLDELYQEAEKELGQNPDNAIKNEITILANNYQNLEDVNNQAINYKSPATRFAYVYKYVAAHADYLYQTIDKLKGSEQFSKTLSLQLLRVTCIGGGPGSDIIGLLKLLLAQNSPSKVMCYLCDKEQAWADSWTEINTHLPASNISFSTNFQPLDVLDSNTWIYQKKFLSADIFTLNFFVSEIVRFDCPAIQDFWRALFENAKSGAYFLYIDNGYTNFSNYFDKQWQPYNLKLVAKEDLSRITPSYNEQASALETYIAKFSNYPKLKAQISYRLLVKP